MHFWLICGGKTATCDALIAVPITDSPIGLDQWLCGIWLIVNCKNGISSCEMARSLGLSQKSAWFLEHRIRFALHQGTFEKMLSGEFNGGKARNMHASKRERRITGTKDRTAVMGSLDREGNVLPNRRKKAIQAGVRRHVEVGSALYTDALLSYEGLVW